MARVHHLARRRGSGAVTDRKALAKAIAALQGGDVLLVTRLDRLARSTRDLLNTLAQIGDRGAAFRSLADAWADTTTAHGKPMITILGGLAEFERSLILKGFPAEVNRGFPRADRGRILCALIRREVGHARNVSQ